MIFFNNFGFRFISYSIEYKRKISRKDAKEAKNVKKKINPEYSGASFGNFAALRETFTLLIFK